MIQAMEIDDEFILEILEINNLSFDEFEIEERF